MNFSYSRSSSSYIQLLSWNNPDKVKYMKEQIRPFEKEFIADKGGVISEGTKNTAMRHAIPTPNTHPIKYKKYVYHGLMKFDLKKRIDYVKFKEIMAKRCYLVGSFMFMGEPRITSDEQQKFYDYLNKAG